MQAAQINWPTTIGNLGLWTRLGIPTKPAHLRTHHLVRFLLFFALVKTRYKYIGYYTLHLCSVNYMIKYILINISPRSKT